MWDHCLGYLYSDVIHWLSLNVKKIMAILITDEGFRPSIQKLLVSSMILEWDEK